MIIALLEVLTAFGIFALTVVANIILSTYYNTKKLKQRFDISRLLDGIIKMLCIGIGLGLLTVIITLISNVAFEGITSSIISTGAIMALYGAAIIKYFTEAYNTAQDVLKNRNIIDDAGADITEPTESEGTSND